MRLLRNHMPQILSKQAIQANEGNVAVVAVYPSQICFFATKSSEKYQYVPKKLDTDPGLFIYV